MVVEKPITETLEQAERLVQAKNETGKLLIPFQSQSTAPTPPPTQANPRASTLT